VDGRPLVEIAQHERVFALALGRRERGLELVPGRGGLQAELLQLGRVVIDPDDLTDLRQPEEAALAEGLAVRRIGHHGLDRGRVAILPPVCRGIRIEVHELLGLDELAHLRARVVGLHDIGRVIAGERLTQRLGQVVEGSRDPLYLDIRIAPLAAAPSSRPRP